MVAASHKASNPKRAKKQNRFRVKHGVLPPSAVVMHLSDDQWESFIEDACLSRDESSVRYVSVKKLGASGDKGRDVEARWKADLIPYEWDLFQGKHYGTPLSPSTAFPELLKFFGHVAAGTYPCPRNYFFCAPRNVGPELHDLIANPTKLKEAFKTAWNEEKSGLQGSAAKRTPELKKVVDDFDFGRIKECVVRDLIRWHSGDRSKHFNLFGIAPHRAPDPAVPPELAAAERRYVAELLRAYAEEENLELTLDDVRASAVYNEHLAAARSTFFCAEGLKRFSRDLYTEEDEFSRLLEMVLKGIRPSLTSPSLKSGMKRIEKAMDLVASVRVDDSPLSSQLRGGDLPGTCHHLVNEDRMKWVR
ncbi:ABC-three component system protein [uncultured Nevskia sp.]|uniref:ABC-three component system protein n=1 Tax=uncultured Nevskia sp. TaxID=228950 RepID=UPI0025EE64BC|nr:ABC-three component system protein [uncultured Nevskia sp.]